MENNIIDEIVNETIEEIEEIPIGITDEEMNDIKDGDENDADR